MAGGYCQLQMPSKLALGVRRTVAGHRLGALKGGVPPPFQCIPAVRARLKGYWTFTRIVPDGTAPTEIHQQTTYSVMAGNRGPVVEGHHSLTTCFTNLPTTAARYITTAPHSPKPFASNRDSGARCLIKYPHPPVSFPTPGKTVPHHPLGDGHQVTVPHPPLGDRTPTVHEREHVAVRGAEQTHGRARWFCHRDHKRCGDMHHRALNIQRPAPKQVPPWSG